MTLSRTTLLPAIVSFWPPYHDYRRFKRNARPWKRLQYHGYYSTIVELACELRGIYFYECQLDTVFVQGMRRSFRSGIPMVLVTCSPSVEVILSLFQGFTQIA